MRGKEQRRGSSVAGGLVPLQAPELEEGEGLWGPGFGTQGQGAQEVGQEPPTSAKAQGKVPAVEPPPPETDEELACSGSSGRRLQRRRCSWGWDTATLVVVREAAGLLMRGQLEGLGGPS